MSELKSLKVLLIFIGIYLLFRFLPTIPVSMVTTTKTDLFTVTGEGKVTAVPDVAQVTAGITSSAGTVTEAQNRANSVINKISAELKKLGVGEKDIQTTSYNLRPDYDFSAGRQVIKGYVADTNLTVKVRQFDKINQVIDTATANGANQIGELVFTLDDATREQLESEARKVAINQAKKKANEIAGQSGITLGRVVNVSENVPTNVRPMPMMAKADSAAAAAEPTQIQPGSSEITVSVVLSYETR